MFCECERWASSACVGETYKKAAGKNFCVLHYPGEEKGDDFARALSEKLKKADFDFRGAVFVGAGRFPNVVFSGAASFYGAVFKDEAIFFAATFKGYTDFRRVQFCKGVDIRRATFCGEADFRNTTFGGKADFSFSTFESAASFFNSDFEVARFISTTFKSGTEFRVASFKGEANFSSATFEEYVTFRGEEKKPVFGPQSSLFLQFARVIKPSGASFHTLGLRPYWFVNVNAREFEFINVRWRETDTRREVESIPAYVSPAHRLLAVACRDLAVNAEENQRYEEASKFRYMAMEALRLERWRGFAFWKLGWWFWLASGYSERAGRAVAVLLGILILFAALYVGLGHPTWGTAAGKAEPAREEAAGWARWSGALLYSGSVMTLQKPEPRPATDAAQAVVMLETILGPVQAALLALAIRRKFMR